MNTLPPPAPPLTSIVGKIFDLFEDQLDLFLLELRYERHLASRRMLHVGVALIFVLTSFVFVQLGIVCALLAAGMRLGWISFVLAAAYGIIGWGIFSQKNRRDTRIGASFQQSRIQLHENLKWIQKHFF